MVLAKVINIRTSLVIIEHLSDMIFRYSNIVIDNMHRADTFMLENNEIHTLCIFCKNPISNQALLWKSKIFVC